MIKEPRRRDQRMSARIMTAEAARIVKISEDRIRQLSDAGILVTERTASGVRLFDRSEVERFAAERAAKNERDAK
jgi:DNA-binding transcriptional MerR regulator